MKRILAALTALVFLTGASALAEAKYTVGVCQLVQHGALDRATLGFISSISEKMGSDVEFCVQNASGDTSVYYSIINTLINDGVDLIMANATPALQVAQAATEEIPILGTSVTDYAAALDISDFTGVTGTNVSGTSDLVPLDMQAQMIREIFPQAQKIGLLYCTAEPNSVYQVEIIDGYLREMGYQTEFFGFTDSNDVAPVATSASQQVDVIYVPTDNTAASCTPALRNVVMIEKKPIVGGDEALCFGCGVAAVSVDYFDLGCITGEMAYEILVNGEDISQMPVRFAPKFEKVYNAELCDYLGIPAPEGYRAID